MTTAADVLAIPNLAVWLRGDSSPTTTAGAAVTLWDDRGSANADGVNATAAERPTYVADPLPGAVWAGGRTMLLSPASASLTAETLFVVAKPSTVSGYHSLRGGSGDGGSGASALIVINGKPTISRQGIADSLVGTTALANNTLAIVTMDLSATAGRLFTNGAANGTVSNPTAPSSGQTSRIGAGYNGGDNWAGAIYEVISFSRVLSSTERAAVHSYLADRYAVQVADYNGTPSADTTAPTVPAGVAAVGLDAGRVQVTWDGSSDVVGVDSYRVQRDGVTLTAAVALASGTRSFIDTSVNPSTAYRYTLSAADAAGNRSAESAAATVITPASATSGNLVERIWTGLAWALVQAVTTVTPGTPTNPTTPTTPTPTIPAGSSTPARWWIPIGGAPVSRVTYETGVNQDGRAQVVWVGSMPDSRARVNPREMGVAAQAQAAWQAYIVDLSTNTTVVDSGVVTGTAEQWVATGFSPVPGRRYRGHARVRAADGQWSPYAQARFVAPSGVTRYFEDYGAVGDGVTRSGADYTNKIYTGPIREALKACQPGDVVKSKAPGTVLTGVTASGASLTSSTAVFTQAMAGKKVIVYRAGKTDASADSWAHRTTVSAVSGDGKTATLTAAVLTNGTGLTAVVGYAEYWTGHMDMDAGMGAPGNGGGWTLDGTGCVFTSLDPNSAGFRTIIPDVTYRNVHYWQKVTATRGNGLNGNTGPFFVESVNAVGIRIIGCYAERARDAGFLIYGGPSDVHVVDCVTDHCNADPFHVTGSAHGVQFIRPIAVFAGDDMVANIGYRSDGDSARPYDITWENPRMIGQDWGRGLSFGGCYDVLATDVVFEGGAMASFLIGSDNDQANTAHVQVRRFTVTDPNVKRGTKPTYTQGTGTGSTIADDPWLKLLNSSSPTLQRDILLEDGTVNNGRYIQFISYGNGPFHDASIILRGITMTGQVNAGSNWLDQGTYPGHIDARGITVPSGSTPASAPANPNS